MNSRGISRDEQFLDYLSRLMDSVVPDGIVVALQWVDNVMDLLGHLQLGKLPLPHQEIVSNCSLLANLRCGAKSRNSE